MNSSLREALANYCHSLNSSFGKTLYEALNKRGSLTKDFRLDIQKALNVDIVLKSNGEILIQSNKENNIIEFKKARKPNIFLNIRKEKGITQKEVAKIVFNRSSYWYAQREKTDSWNTDEREKLKKFFDNCFKSPVKDAWTTDGKSFKPFIPNKEAKIESEIKSDIEKEAVNQ